MQRIFGYKERGFTIMDSLIAIGLIIIVFMGIFGAYQLGLRVLSQASDRVIATSVAVEYLERARNLPYSDVGVQGGFPAGIFTTSASTVRNGITYDISMDIDYIADDADGLSNPPDTCVNDYKRVLVTVAWTSRTSGQVSLATDVAPENILEECDDSGGILRITVFDALGVPVPSATVDIEDVDTTVTDVCLTDSTGVCQFILPVSPPGGEENYKITVSRTGYTQVTTYRPGDTYQGTVVTTPDPIHATVFDGLITDLSYSIDQVGSMVVRTLSPTDFVYYVRMTGDDSNDGYTPNTAFATISQAASVVGPGDTVYVGAGTYNEQVDIATSGTAGNMVSFIADTGGAATGDAGTVLLDSNNTRCSAFELQSGVDYILLDGFTATEYQDCGGNDAAFRGAGFNDNNIFRNLVAFNTSRDGLNVRGKNNLAENCLFYDVTHDGMEWGGVNNILRNCTITQVGAFAIQSEVAGNTYENNFLDGAIDIASGGPLTTETWLYNDWIQGALPGTGNFSIEPDFVDPANDDFRLMQIAAGQAFDSALVDAGSDLATIFSLDAQTTRTDGAPDAGTVDVGYHYIITHPIAPSAPAGIAAPSINIDVQGQKTVGQDSGGGNIYKYAQTVTTDNGGQTTINNAEWDSYTYSVSNPSLLFSYPTSQPIALNPNSSQNVYLYVAAANTLLVTVADSVTTDPVFSASVRLTASGFDKTQQTDMNGQTLFIPLNADTYAVEVSAIGYDTFNGNVAVSGNTTLNIQIVKNPS